MPYIKRYNLWYFSFPAKNQAMASARVGCYGNGSGKAAPFSSRAGKEEMPSTVVSFAPSPTGLLHIGNARTALLNALYARREKGTFILRLDDTDRARSEEQFAAAIREDLAWLGIPPDREERQSARTARYEEVLQKLLAAGLVYPCFETEEELAFRRRRQLAAHKPPVYDRAALKLSEAERAKLEGEGRKPNNRFMLGQRKIAWNDLVRGKCEIDTASLSDTVVRRADGHWLYTLTSVIDDVDMGVTHVIRGEDHLTNTAAQIEMFEALGAKPPLFAHHNLLTLPSGEGMSKRLGHLSLRSLRKEGQEPLATAAAAVLVGSADAIEPVAGLDALAAKVDFSKISHGSARFDPKDLDALTARTLHAMPFASAKPRLAAFGIKADEAFWLAVRGNLASFEEARIWWSVVHEPLKSSLQEGERETSAKAAEHLPPAPWDAQTWDKKNWDAWIETLKTATGRKGRELFHPLRIALTGRENGPELRALLPLIGHERAFKRLRGETA
jgi:glutamyl-tRNA synthetase